MQVREPKIGWWTRTMVSLGLAYPPEQSIPEEEDGILLPGKTPKVLHFPTDTNTQIAVLTPANLNAIKVPADF